MNNIDIEYIGDDFVKTYSEGDLAKAYSEGYKQGKFDMMNHTRSEWINDGFPLFLYRCSLCGGCQTSKTKYCSHCGAKMQGEYNDN